MEAEYSTKFWFVLIPVVVWVLGAALGVGIHRSNSSAIYSWLVSNAKARAWTTTASVAAGIIAGLLTEVADLSEFIGDNPSLMGSVFASVLGPFAEFSIYCQYLLVKVGDKKDVECNDLKNDLNKARAEVVELKDSLFFSGKALQAVNSVVDRKKESVVNALAQKKLSPEDLLLFQKDHDRLYTLLACVHKIMIPLIDNYCKSRSHDRLTTNGYSINLRVSLFDRSLALGGDFFDLRMRYDNDKPWSGATATYYKDFFVLSEESPDTAIVAAARSRTTMYIPDCTEAHNSPTTAFKFIHQNQRDRLCSLVVIPLVRESQTGCASRVVCLDTNIKGFFHSGDKYLEGFVTTIKNLLTTRIDYEESMTEYLSSVVRWQAAIPNRPGKVENQG